MSWGLLDPEPEVVVSVLIYVLLGSLLWRLLDSRRTGVRTCFSCPWCHDSGESRVTIQGAERISAVTQMQQQSIPVEVVARDRGSYARGRGQAVTLAARKGVLWSSTGAVAGLVSL
jgi:hypothetical protein